MPNLWITEESIKMRQFALLSSKLTGFVHFYSLYTFFGEKQSCRNCSRVSFFCDWGCFVLRSFCLRIQAQRLYILSQYRRIDLFLSKLFNPKIQVKHNDPMITLTQNLLVELVELGVCTYWFPFVKLTKFALTRSNLQ